MDRGHRELLMQDIKISNGYIQLWASYLRSLNIEPLAADFLVDLRPQLCELIDQPFDLQVPVDFLNMILLRTQKQLACPQLILAMVPYIRPEHFGLLGYMVSKSSSISEMMGYIMRFQRLVIDGSEMVPLQLRQHDRSIELCWGYQDERYNLLNELTIAAMVQLGRFILQEHALVLRRVRFAHAAQIARIHYQKFYATEVQFSQPDYGFELVLQGLSLKSQQADPMLLQLLVRQAEAAIAANPTAESLLEQAQKLVAEHLKNRQQAMKIGQLAKQLCLSTRTLQRQLNEQGMSFKKLLERERIKRCEMLLQQPLGLTEIARQLDYSDQSALTRAYKAATGRTLLQYRKQLKQNQA